MNFEPKSILGVPWLLGSLEKPTFSWPKGPPLQENSPKEGTLLVDPLRVQLVFKGLRKKSKFKTEETGVMEHPLVHQAVSFHFTNLSYCCERLVPSTCFELRTLDCCCWMMFLRGESNFSAYQILTRLKFNAYQILARTIF